MYSFRRVLESGVQINTELGKIYWNVNRGESPDRFKTLTDGLEKENVDRAYGCIIGEHGETHLLFETETCYIMSENGKTFAKI